MHYIIRNSWAPKYRCGHLVVTPTAAARNAPVSIDRSECKPAISVTTSDYGTWFSYDKIE